MTDRAGRAGIGISAPHAKGCGANTYIIIVNPRTGQLLDIEEIQTTPTRTRIGSAFVVSW